MKDNLLESLKTFLMDSLAAQSNSFSSGVKARKDANKFALSNLRRPPTQTAFRVFSNEEQEKLGALGQDFVIQAEKIQLLNPATREMFLKQLMASESKTVSLDEMKWVLLKLLNKRLSGEQLDFLNFVLFTNSSTAH